MYPTQKMSRGFLQFRGCDNRIKISFTVATKNTVLEGRNLSAQTLFDENPDVLFQRMTTNCTHPFLVTANTKPKMSSLLPLALWSMQERRKAKLMGQPLRLAAASRCASGEGAELRRQVSRRTLRQEVRLRGADKENVL